MGRYFRASDTGKISVTDPLFGKFVSLVAERIVPYQWEILNDRVEGTKKSYCLENFRIAAGERSGRHQGAVFVDTDAYKWLETVAYCIAGGACKEFISVADGLIALLGKAQQKDGYLDTYFIIDHPGEKWTNLAEGHELYCAGHLIEAAVAYYQATGKKNLLDIAVRFADLIVLEFGPEGKNPRGCPGHSEVELALVRLYSATGYEKYLRLSEHFVNIRGEKPNYLIEELKENSDKGRHIFSEFHGYDPEYAQSQEPPVQQKTAEGHAVRAMYLYSAMADLAADCDNAAMRAACEALWDNTTKRRMYITGALGSSAYLERFTADYDLPNDRMYGESCASVGLMMFGQRMAQLTGDASYYDMVELALCNTVLGGMSASGDRYFYVNPLEVWPANCLPSTSMAHVKPVRQPWFDVACCPTNIARTLASLGQYIYAESGDAVFINMFISSSMCTDYKGAKVEVKVDSSYMKDGRVRISVLSWGKNPPALRVRIPAYFTAPRFTLNGRAFSPRIDSGYALFTAAEGGESVFEIKGGVEPVFLAANEQVRADAGKVALMMGPYVYCLEETDNGNNLANVFVKPDTPVEVGAPEAAPFAGLPGELPALSYTGVKVTKGLQEDGTLYGKPLFARETVWLTAVPYCLWSNRQPGEMLVWVKALL
jgi:DUF1680 family protein